MSRPITREMADQAKDFVHRVWCVTCSDLQATERDDMIDAMYAIIDALVADDEPSTDTSTLAFRCAKPDDFDCSDYPGNLENCVACEHSGRADDTPQPKPVEWKAGDWVWHTDASDGHCALIRLKTVFYRIDEQMWELADKTCVSASNLHIPTLSQLAKEIGKDADGEPILAWALSHNDTQTVMYYSDDMPADGNILRWTGHVYRDEVAELMNIPIITADQVSRHYDGAYPPEPHK
jgi:hypothetical protein